MKVRTASQLVSNLDSELAWRQRELITLLEVIRNSKELRRDALTRAFIPILYAHWEGFIKTAAAAFCNLISNKNYKYRDLKLSFIGTKALAFVNQMHEIKKKIFVASVLTEKIYSLEDEKVVIDIISHLGNVGNLNYDLFMQVVGFLSIDTKPFKEKDELIDDRLLRLRNEIAHGEYMLVTLNDIENLSADVMNLMRAFKDELQNSAVLLSYHRT